MWNHLKVGASFEWAVKISMDKEPELSFRSDSQPPDSRTLKGPYIAAAILRSSSSAQNEDRATDCSPCAEGSANNITLLVHAHVQCLHAIVTPFIRARSRSKMVCWTWWKATVDCRCNSYWDR